MKTTVVNVRGKDRATLEVDPDFVYVGRASRGGWKQSPFGNPYAGHHPALGPRTPGRLVAMFFIWLETGEPQEPENPKAQARRRDEILRLLPTLKGKKLGCWCCDWSGEGEPSKPCHAVVLATMADAKGGTP